MPFTNTGRSGTALYWIGSYVIPNGMTIGSGSGTKNAGTTSLTSPLTFKSFTSRSGATPRFAEFTADWGSTELSGVTLREFCVQVSGGALFSAEYIPDSTFNGSTELHIEVTWEQF